MAKTSGRRFVVSDLHLGHVNIIKYANRPFANEADMNDTLIRNWNRVVEPHDKVYDLGDIAMRKTYLGLVKHLNGHKRLIRGNHDIFDVREYLDAGYERVEGVRVFSNEGILMTHIPVHPSTLGHRFAINAHGHVHDQSLNNPRYWNACVEVRGYQPTPFDEIVAAVRKLA